MASEQAAQEAPRTNAMEMLRLKREGHSNAEIARRLGLSKQWVGQYLARHGEGRYPLRPRYADLVDVVVQEQRYADTVAWPSDEERAFSLLKRLEHNGYIVESRRERQ